MRPELLAKYDRPVPRYTSYPTAPHFHAGIAPHDYCSWLAALPPEPPLSLYLHVPFCQSLCWYCGCHTTVARRYGSIGGYLEVLLREIELVAEALGAVHPVSHVHFGGGTPTMLAPHDLERLGRGLGRHFALLPDAEIAVELDRRGDMLGARVQPRLKRTLLAGFSSTSFRARASLPAWPRVGGALAWWRLARWRTWSIRNDPSY